MLIVIVTAAITSAVSAVLSGNHTASCTPTGANATDASGYGPEQITNAATIVAIGKQMNIPERGWIIALATAIQESGLRNLNHGDRDSLGLFQQRPSQGWGTPAQITDPAYATTQFYRHLLAVPDWQQMSINDAAQAVQRSGFPDAYARHEPTAQQLLATVHGSTCTGTPTGTWAIPVSGQCTSGFGPRGSEFHRGQDIAAPIGIPIVAASNGTVIDAGPASGYGLWVRIQHTNDMITTYGHNNRNLVHPGQEVQAGQPIAEVGNKGQSTGPHLHFQIDIGSQAQDPVAFYQQQSAPPLCS
ncbi:M23 family metallopeptidase [Saccharopolyspora sp. NPDC002376]